MLNMILQTIISLYILEFRQIYHCINKIKIDSIEDFGT